MSQRDPELQESARELPLRAVVRSEGYKGWWWHIEDAAGRPVDFIANPVTDPTLPDGVVLRGRAFTRWGAKSRAADALRQAQRHVPPAGGWRRNWVPVSDELAAAALELDVEDRTKALAKDVERVKRQLEGLRKEGRR